MVRWSVSSPNRGRPSAIRSASSAHTPATGPASTEATSSRATNASTPWATVRTGTPGTAVRRQHHGVRRGDVLDLDLRPEPHPVQELHQRPSGAGLDVGPDRLPVVDQVERVLDVAVRRQQQRLGRHAGLEVLDVLRGQRVQPGQPVGAADPDHRAVRQVDRRLAGDQGALLAERVAVVRGHAGVGRVGRTAPGRDSSGLVMSRTPGSGRRSRSAPRRSGSRAARPAAPTSGSASSTSVSMTTPQSRQTRCRWAPPSAAWYVGAPWPRCAWVTRPSSSSSSRVR